MTSIMDNDIAQFASVFTKLIANNDFHYDDMVCILNKIMQTAKTSFNYDENTILRMANSMNVINSIVKIKTTLWNSDGSVQYPVASSLSSLLLDTLKENYHCASANCNVFNDKKKTCGHGNTLVNTNQHVFTNIYHEFDSLNVHLVLTCVYNGAYLIQKNESDSKIMQAMFFGLFHDIGKMATVQTYEFAEKLYIGFPAHAEIGAMQFQMHWNDEMSSYISKIDYMNVSTAILRHMCGYHGDETIETHYKRNLLILDTIAVREMLCANRVGDHFGKLSSMKECSDEHFFTEQQKFEMTMNNTTQFSLINMLSKEAQKINCNKIVLFIVGASGSGKTHFTSMLNKRFPNLCGFVSRDRAIAKVCVGVDERFEGMTYTKMYKIYTAYKDVYKSFDESVINNEIYANAITHLIDAQRDWNNYVENNNLTYPIVEIANPKKRINIIENVQHECNLQINAILHDMTNRFIVLDSVTNCFPMFIEQYMPNVFKKLFRVHIHIQSFEEKTASSIADSIDDQLKISSVYGIYDPIMPNAFKKNKKMFSSLSSSNHMNGSLPAECFTSKYRPHLIAGICTRANGSTIGYDETFETLDRLISDEIVHDGFVNETDIFGVEHETKDMNILEFYSHLIKRFNNDRSKIHEFFTELGFTSNAYLGSSKIKEMSNIAYLLNEISTYWYNKGIISSVVSVDDFVANKNKCVDNYMNSIVTLKYLDHCHGERFWQNKWAIEMRGTVLFVNPETFVPCVLSFKLNRGAEVLTNMVIAKKIETQDIIGSKSDILDIEQQDTCNRICSNSDMDAFLTSKGDGSLMVINVYIANSLHIMKPIVSIFGSDYSKMWMNTSMKYFDDKIMLIPSTQGTVIESGFMSDYMVTSMLCGTGIATRDDVSKFNNCIDAFEHYSVSFYQKISAMISGIDAIDGNTITLNFEAMCAGRRGLFNDSVHTELAIEYENDRLIFLGLSFADRLFYVPHMLWSAQMVFENGFPFEEPIWWTITNASQINNMIEEMNRLIVNEITKKEYFDMFPPNNIHFSVDDAIIDYEGWIIMKKAVFKQTDVNKEYITKKFDFPVTIYSKAKTEAYYMSHKFRASNIEALVKLAYAVGDNRFPLCNKILNLHATKPMNVRFTLIKDALNKLFDFSDESLMSIMREHNKTQMKSGKKDMMNGFEKRSFDIQCRMLLSIRSDFIEKAITQLYMDIFPEICKFDDITQICMKITQQLKLWDASCDKIQQLSIESPILSQLMSCIF